jgi:F0F1-type ATP synthase epsilon subunit
MPEAPWPFRFTVRTPHEVVLETDALSVRVPTETGQVGLRPRSEPAVLAVEASLVLVQTAAGTLFVGTAGGLLTCDGRQATLLTPLAVVGEEERSLLAELDRVLGEPSEEMEVRTSLERLEGRILREVRREGQERERRQGAGA